MRIDYSWRLQRDTPPAVARTLVADLNSPVVSSAVLLDTGTALFSETMALIISGTASAAYLASKIQDVVCRGRKPGLIIDARHTPLSITETKDLPGGTVITITADGEQQTHDACSNDSNLAAVIAALHSPT